MDIHTATELAYKKGRANAFEEVFSNLDGLLNVDINRNQTTSGMFLINQQEYLKIRRHLLSEKEALKNNGEQEPPLTAVDTPINDMCKIVFNTNSNLNRDTVKEVCKILQNNGRYSTYNVDTEDCESTTNETLGILGE